MSDLWAVGRVMLVGPVTGSIFHVVRVECPGVPYDIDEDFLEALRVRMPHRLRVDIARQLARDAGCR